MRDELLSPPRSWAALKILEAKAAVDGGALKQRARTAVVQREEFVRLLLDFAATSDDRGSPQALADARDVARKLLGVKTAAAAKGLLVTLRQRIAELELAHPEWSSSKRADMAMLETLLAGPMGGFMTKLIGWYDQTIDRVDGAFTGRVRVWTTGFSALLVLVLQLDSFDLLARLNADGALRDKVVVTALQSMQGGSVMPGGNARTQGKAVECARAHLNVAGLAPNMTAYADCMGLGQATQLGLIAWPQNLDAWRGNWKQDIVALPLQWLGMLLSLGLLSLGAPFWYEMLSNLIKLRSTIARKDDAARVERQTTQAG